jgi:hypothetical protein
VFVTALVVTVVLTFLVNIQLYRLGTRYRTVHDLPHHPMWTVSGVGYWRPLFQRHDDPELARLRRESALLLIAWLASAAITMFAFPGNSPSF